MARITKKASAFDTISKPTIQNLSPRDALAVELALEFVRSKGTIRTDVTKSIVDVANEFAVLLGWQKAKKTLKQLADESLPDVETGDETE